MYKMLEVYFALLALLVLLVLLLARPGGRPALPEAAAVVWEAASTVLDPSAPHAHAHVHHTHTHPHTQRINFISRTKGLQQHVNV